MEKWLEESDVVRAKRTVWFSIVFVILNVALLVFGRYIQGIGDDSMTESFNVYSVFYPIIFTLMYSFIAYIDLAGRAKAVIGIVAALVAGLWITFQLNFPHLFGDSQLIIRFLSPFMVYSFFRGAALKNGRAIISGAITSIGLVGFSLVFDTYFFYELIDKFFSHVMYMDWGFEVSYNIASSLYLGMCLMAYLFCTWMLDQYFLKGKEAFKKCVDINAPVNFKKSSDYIYFFSICYSIYIVIIRGYSNLMDQDVELGSFGGQMLMYTLTICFSLIPLVLVTLFISKINHSIVLAKKRQPFFIHWLLMIPLINIIILIIVHHQRVKQERTNTVALLKVDQNQKTFRGSYILLVLLVVILSFMADQNTDFLIFLVVHTVLFFLILIIVTFQPTWLLGLLGFLIIADVSFTLLMNGNVIDSLGIALSATCSMILYRHAFYPLKKEKIEEYFQQDVRVTKDYYDTIDGNQELFDEEAI